VGVVVVVVGPNTFLWIDHTLMGVIMVSLV
jgi:hypothetical protein